eukprot:CAMPEP_0202493724 /NCGR_PEP_ID=MMETSP1361-20130828/9956_1 /ASSEMBLY_ACC=CAM_ASM_000849 /TAXON_ID=210615 /ORGANISM="Staurosira complex sp., Strain CCMP2646" /LENGTH=137 /DNA_ID=CAMNT_0049124069 /DNA_START=115 /DNA_END=528 /DNA_ORIENTATION=+
MTRRQISTQSFFQMTMAVILLTLTLPRVAAYMQGVPRPHVKSIRSTSALSAWSIPAPPAFSTPSLGASWYNEVDPTARQTIYNDDTPLDYTFSAPGDDWPSSFDAQSHSSSLQNQTPETRINPLRRAVKWLRKNSSQ